MEITVKLVSNRVEEIRIEVAIGDTYGKLLERLKINPEEVVVLRDGKPVPEDDRVADKGDARREITIIRIVSSG